MAVMASGPGITYSIKQSKSAKFQVGFILIMASLSGSLMDAGVTNLRVLC